MNFEFTEEQKLFADSVHRFAVTHLETDALKRAHDPRYPFDVAKPSVVVQFAHLPREGTDHLLVSVIDIDEPAVELLLHRLNQGSIFKQENVRVKNTGILRPDRLGRGDHAVSPRRHGFSRQ